MEFKKYQHIERFGNDEVLNIEFGECFIFPKIDGTQGSIWFNNEHHIIQAANKNRVLSEDADNAGFYAWVQKQENINEYLKHYDHRLYGEWLVPHTLKTYRDDAWKQFYIFDVMDDRGLCIPYNDYCEDLDSFGLEYISPLRIINNPDYEKLTSLLEENDYLIKDGEGAGEGIVIKRYNFQSVCGRQTWAKIVRTELKDKHRKLMGAPNQDGRQMIEQDMVERFCTAAFIEKTYTRIKKANNGWTSRCIPQLLSTVYHDFVVEELWDIIKRHKNPTINFKTLNFLVVQKIKECKSELF